MSCQISPKTYNNKKFNNSLCCLGSRSKQTFFNFADKNANWFKLWKSVSEVRNHLRFQAEKGFNTGT